MVFTAAIPSVWTILTHHLCPHILKLLLKCFLKKAFIDSPAPAFLTKLPALVFSIALTCTLHLPPLHFVFSLSLPTTVRIGISLF